MDLRRRLVIRLGLFFAALTLAFGAIWLLDLREDAMNEQMAAARLIDLLLAHDGNNAEARIQEILTQGGLRHAEAILVPANETLPPKELPGWLSALGLNSAPIADHRIPVGTQLLVIRADSESEFREKLRASFQVLSMLIAFCMACLVMTWRAVDRALSPVKELEAGLSRLEEGDEGAHLPHFELREFSSIANVIDRVATRLARSRERQRRLTQQLMEVQDKERRDLAAELHDEIGQSLTAITASAAYIERHATSAPASTLTDCARDIGNESRRIAVHVRQMLTSLRPYGIEDSGIREALEELVAGWRARLPDQNIEANIQPLPRLSAAVALAIYRCLQEALTNCVRHAQGRSIKVICIHDNGRVRLSVSDDGVGNARLLGEQAGGGLLGLRERLVMVDGTLNFEDVPTGGVVVIATVPVAATEATQ